MYNPRNYRHIIHTLIVVLFFCSVFYVGRLGFVYQLYLSKPEIEVTTEINPGICMIKINEFNSSFIKGESSDLTTRFSYMDKVFLVSDDGRFEISR